ncbi:MAG: hypothetical protein M0Q23_03025 [Syntrophales bacterium]|jgi:hypothetical protein|nr:hypothetical protein [Syntrophales bacterium]MCK9527618.1 hypothetical protein [Syntrophales bacterium]MDX9922235.1 hypothetical protein [Syntrophales bacterium]
MTEKTVKPSDRVGVFNQLIGNIRKMIEETRAAMPRVPGDCAQHGIRTVTKPSFFHEASIF